MISDYIYTNNYLDPRFQDEMYKRMNYAMEKMMHRYAEEMQYKMQYVPQYITNTMAYETKLDSKKEKLQNLIAHYYTLR